MAEIIGYQNIFICNAILVGNTNYWTKNGGKNDIFSAIWQITSRKIIESKNKGS